MKVTYNWLKDYINLKISPDQLAEKLTMAGLEVVSQEAVGGDFVFEIEITSNRPDWLSLLGIAREVGAICGGELKNPDLKEAKSKIKSILPLKISVTDKKDCSFYSARIIRDVEVKPSPEWLKNRLELMGCRSVNNVVDITNYVLFALGQPLHAFDLDKLVGGELSVRRAKLNEKIITIDGQERALGPEILVIAGKDNPVAIAGVMGGKDTEVTAGTHNILIESAVFNPMLVRCGRKKLGLQSESAYRFERGVNLSAATLASLKAQELILELAFGRPGGYKTLGISKLNGPAIDLDPVYVNKVLGAEIPVIKIKQILSKLGLQVKLQSKNILSVKIPDFRLDLKLPIDLVEEVARIYGYEKIAQTLPAVKPSEKIFDRGDTVSGLKNILCGLGLHEVITYSLVDRSLLAKSGIKTTSELIEILNPLSCEQEVLRPTLLPSLIRCLVYNLDQKQEQIRIFEVANIFSDKNASVQEEPVLAIALCGTNSFLVRQGLVKDTINLLHLKGILEVLFNKLGITGFDFVRQDDDKISIIVGQKQIGIMFDLNQQALTSFDIKNRQVVLAEINLGQLISCVKLEKKFLSILKYPAITRDLSFVIKQNIAVKDVLSAIKEKGAPLLHSVEVIDYYQGKQIPAGFKGLTISCIYRLEDRTLTEEEILPFYNATCTLLQERFAAKLR